MPPALEYCVRRGSQVACKVVVCEKKQEMTVKTVLLMGDSIRCQSEEFVIEELGAEFRVLGVEDNCGNTRRWLEELDEWLESAGPVDVIHFNVGLHDIKREGEGAGCLVPINEYRDSLLRIVATLRETGAELIWATTTPVIYERHHEIKGFDRLEQDVEDYNEVAAEIMAECGVRTNDLHTRVMEAGVEDMLGPDGVHYGLEGRELIADCIAVAVRGTQAPWLADADAD